MLPSRLIAKLNCRMTQPNKRAIPLTNQTWSKPSKHNRLLAI